MKLLHMAGFGDDISKQIAKNPKAVAALVQVAKDFLGAGGEFGPDDYIYMLEVERAACRVAKEHLRAENAAMIGYASQGTIEALEVQSKADGGLAKRDALLRASAERIVESMMRGVFHNLGDKVRQLKSDGVTK